MRVIAGELKGRPLLAPRGWKVRPTSDRVREAIFSALGEAVGGARVLDLYCGTGALAIEALSRGAAEAVLVDRDTRPALGNVETLGLSGRAELVRSDAGRGLAARAEDEAATSRASASPAARSWFAPMPAAGWRRVPRRRQRGDSTSSSSMPHIDSPTAWGRN